MKLLFRCTLVMLAAAICLHPQTAAAQAPDNPPNLTPSPAVVPDNGSSD